MTEPVDPQGNPLGRDVVGGPVPARGVAPWLLRWRIVELRELAGVPVFLVASTLPPTDIEAAAIRERTAADIEAAAAARRLTLERVDA